ncbi:MAG TPA: ABC transporter permease [Acidobacteriaceae bacterium]|nr:ABC transporter permease [Acidobacteriaceae bacterium]
MLNDLRFAWRQLKRAPGFALTAVLTLALGIGATTAIFTLVYDVMLRPLPLPQPEQLVRVQEKVAEWRDMYPTLPVSANHFTFWQQHSKSFAAIAALEEYAMPFESGEAQGGRAMHVDVVSATPGIFTVLGVQPALGRAFNESEGQKGHERVAVITDALWREQFGGDREILGRTLKLDGFTYTVVGVMPASFRMPSTWGGKEPLSAIVPMAFDKELLEEAMGDLNYFGLARLKPGVTVAAANAELNAEQKAIASTLPANQKATLSAVLTPWQEDLVGGSRKALMILLGAVAGLLLVGCVNIANLLLARAAGQKHQMAVAAALGARRSEMLRMAMRETVVLAALGCGLGIVLAMAIVPLMQHYLPPELNFRGALHLDWVGAGCALLLAGAATLLAGAAPAWMVSRTAPQEVLHSESRLASESRGSKHARRVLVGVEVAVSVALVLMTGLLVASLTKLMRVDRGFDTERTLAVKVELPYEAYPNRPKRAEFYRDALVKLNALPGVEQAALTSVLPLSGNGWGDIAQLPGDTRPWTQLPGEEWRWVSPNYFETIHLRLIRGRFFNQSEWGKNEAVLSERTAKALWGDKDPVGQQFHRAGAEGEAPFTVVGVVSNARTVTLAKADPMIIYVPYWFRADADGGIVMRTRQAPAAMAESIRKAIWSVDSGVAVPQIRLLSGVVADSVADRRFEMDLLVVFAVSALLLAGLGVYGVVTYSVVQRQREIGLRIALGAQRANIYRLILREGLLPVVAGAGAGIALALGSARLVGSLLFEVSPYDPGIAAGAVSLLLVAGMSACWLPARRAAQVEPMEALRAE